MLFFSALHLPPFPLILATSKPMQVAFPYVIGGYWLILLTSLGTEQGLHAYQLTPAASAEPGVTKMGLFYYYFLLFFLSLFSTANSALSKDNWSRRIGLLFPRAVSAGGYNAI